MCVSPERGLEYMDTLVAYVQDKLTCRRASTARACEVAHDVRVTVNEESCPQNGGSQISPPSNMVLIEHPPIGAHNFETFRAC